jgi:hypothetical protein
VEKQKEWSLYAIPKVQKHLKLFPDDETWRVNYAILHYFAGQPDKAKAIARSLTDLRDGNSLYNTACLYCELKDHASGLATFRKSIEAGYRNIQYLKSFLDGSVGTLKGTPTWDEANQMVEVIEREQAETNNA